MEHFAKSRAIGSMDLCLLLMESLSLNHMSQYVIIGEIFH